MIFIFNMWLSKHLQMTPNVLQLFSLISQCFDSCILPSRLLDFFSSPAMPPIHASAWDVLHFFTHQTPTETSRPRLEITLFEELFLARLGSFCHVNHSHLYCNSCLPYCTVVICRSVPDPISLHLAISFKRSVIIAWLSFKKSVVGERDRVYLLMSLLRRAAD